MNAWSKSKLFFLLLVLLVSACKKDVPLDKVDDSKLIVVPVLLAYDLSSLEDYEGFSSHIDRGLLEHKAIDEASGMAVSHSNPDRLWVHNDKGDPNRLFVVGTHGQNYGFFWITGTGNRDWEDMCIAPGPVDGVPYLYVGDIGDNDAVYTHVVVNRFVEPDISGLDSVGMNRVEEGAVDRLVFTYPDGPRDAEALMVDPWTKDIYIISKRDFHAGIYVAPYPQSTTESTVLTKIAQFPFSRVLASDISFDGTQIAVKTDRIIYYWKRAIGESVLDALRKNPAKLPYFVEPQGEIFAWTPDGNGYFTLSEKSGAVWPKLYFYQRK